MRKKAVLCEADDRCLEARIGRCSCGGADLDGWDQRTDVLPVEGKYTDLEVDQVRQMSQLVADLT